MAPFELHILFSLYLIMEYPLVPEREEGEKKENQYKLNKAMAIAIGLMT